MKKKLSELTLQEIKDICADTPCANCPIRYFCDAFIERGPNIEYEPIYWRFGDNDEIEVLTVISNT